MKPQFFITGILVTLIVVISALLMAGLSTLGIALIGWVVSLIFPALSVFQGSLLALGAGLITVYGFVRILVETPSAMSHVQDEDWDEDEDEDEDDEPPIVRWRRERPVPVSPSVQTKKTRK